MLSLWLPWAISPWLFVLLGMLLGAASVCGLAWLGWSRVQQWILPADTRQADALGGAQWLYGALAGIVAAGLSFWQFGNSPAMLAALVFVAALLALGWIDARSGYLPDVLTQPLLWLGLLVNLYEGFVALPQAVLGAVSGYMVFWLLAWLFERVTGRQGLGYGDFKLLAALGAWLGVAALPLLLLVASASGLIWALIWRWQGKVQPGEAISFGPFLALAGCWHMLWPLA